MQDEGEDKDEDEDMERKTRMKMKEKAKRQCCHCRCYCCRYVVGVAHGPTSRGLGNGIYPRPTTPLL